MRVPTVTRSRDRETVHVRPYERVFGNLSLTVSDLSAKIPPFNPQKILAAAVAGDDQSAEPQPDAEVSFSTCDFVPAPPRTKVAPAICELNSLLPKVKPATLLPVDDVMEQVRDVAKSSGIGAPQLVNPNGAAPMRLGYASDNEPDPYLGFEARIVPNERDAVAQDPNQRRHRPQRTHHRREEGRDRRRDPARLSAPRRRSSRRSSPCLGRRRTRS